MMMKASLILVALFQILNGVSAFQPSAGVVSRQATMSSSLFQSPQPTTTTTWRKASTLPMDQGVDTAANPWNRVRTTVSSTTQQLNGLRKKIAKSGVATAISYSFVSNVFTSVAVSLAWYTFSLQTGTSPVSPGQWKSFLALYGGFYAINSLLKPVRFMVALGVVPYTERIMATFQSQFNDSRKVSVACSTALLLVSSGTIMASAIGLASVVAGVPIFPGAL